MTHEIEEQKPSPKQTYVLSNSGSAQENISAEPQVTRKPVTEPIITRRTPPSVERVSLEKYPYPH